VATLLERFFKKGSPSVAIGKVVAELRERAAAVVVRGVEPELCRARLADGLREHQLAPMAAEELQALVADFDEGAWARLELVAALVSGAAMRPVWRSAERDGAALMREAVGAVKSKPLLTLELIHQSDLRAEELARAFLAALQVRIGGESEAQSNDRMERLDYERLLAQAELAKKQAESRMEELRKLQEQQQPARRGKW
jgi:hypothetical protein